MKRSTAFLAAVSVLLLGSAAMAAKVDICHVPPDNPGNAHTISVSQTTVPAHLAHGDSLGACECQTDGNCADANLCDVDSCVRGKCEHAPVGCPAQPCVQDLVCVPETGACEGSPVECGDGDVCDPSADGCVPCAEARLSVSSSNTSLDCPDASDCAQCCVEVGDRLTGGLFSTCDVVATLIDDFPNGCFCLGCGCDN
jgi:hypothetical protein